MKENNLLSISTYPNQTCSEKPVIAAIYARVSSGRQVNGYSLEEQIRLSRERCKMMKWKIRYIFCEEAKSAGTTDRPKFQMMLQKAKQGTFDVLVFWKLDRFCRSLLDVVNVEKELCEYGVSLHSITEQIDTTTSFGRFNFRNIASAAEWERDMITERSRLGMKALAMQHKWPNRLPPLGYNKKKDGHLKINLKETELVRFIFRRYKQTRSMPQIAFELNKKGIKTKRGEKWSTTSIKNIIDNEIYIGNYSVSDVEAVIKEYRIISTRLFKTTQCIKNRYREHGTAMPPERKKATIDRVFNEYLS
ncbi:MAG: recombinase family protein, partial [Thermoplasmata archaeon]|nr:recombinase family protein [Thermoplasmata archaeon]